MGKAAWGLARVVAADTEAGGGPAWVHAEGVGVDTVRIAGDLMGPAELRTGDRCSVQLLGVDDQGDAVGVVGAPVGVVGPAVSASVWGQRSLPGGGFANFQPGPAGSRCVLEASLPKRVSAGRGDAAPNNGSPVPWASAAAAVRDLVREAERCGVALDVDGARVTRLDGVRDFVGIDRPGRYVSSFRRVKPKGRAAVHTFVSADTGVTLRVGNGQRLGRMYDKAAELSRQGVRLERPQLRTEMQLRRKPLEAAGIVSVDSLGAGWSVSRAAFAWCEWDRSVVCESEAVVRVWALDGWTKAEKRGAVAALSMLGAGFDWDDFCSPNSATVYRRVLDAAGVAVEVDGVAVVDVSGAADRFLMLDYEAGVEVAA